MSGNAYIAQAVGKRRRRKGFGRIRGVCSGSRSEGERWYRGVIKRVKEERVSGRGIRIWELKPSKELKRITVARISELCLSVCPLVQAAVVRISRIGSLTPSSLSYTSFSTFSTLLASHTRLWPSTHTPGRVHQLFIFH